MIGAASRPRQLHGADNPITARLARVRDTLSRVIDAMRDPMFELDINEGAAVVAAYNLAKGAGVVPPPAFADALIGVLRRQIGETFEGLEDDADTDADTCVDDGFENDECSDREAA